MTTQHIPLLIIGSGPAGYMAAVYAARAGIVPFVATGLQAGGQLTKTSDIENFPAFDSISGFELMDKMREQAEKQGTQFIEDEIASVDFSKKPFVCITDGGEEYACDAVIIATGAAPRKLNLPREEELTGRGVSYCATCDGAFYRKKKVAVIGGGNTAVEDALFLANMAEHVTLIHRRDTLRAEKVSQERLLNHPKISVRWDSVIVSFEENAGGLSGIVLENVKTNEQETLDVDGVFIAVGHVPNTSVFKGQLDLDDQGFVKTQNGRPFTSIDGVFAAGDVQELHYRQAVTAAAGGCKAAIEAEKYLSAKK